MDPPSSLAALGEGAHLSYGPSLPDKQSVVYYITPRVLTVTIAPENTSHATNNILRSKIVGPPCALFENNK
jgi:hypothetical protein